jgi:hypothetical protein
MTAVDNVLEHHGVKGQKWGVRRNRGELKVPTEVMLKTKPGDYVRSTGGKHLPASEDAKTVQIHRQKARTSTTDSLSNKELQELVTRMNLEQQYSKLAKSNDRSGRAARFIKQLVTKENIETAQKIKKFADSPQGAAMKAKLKAG